MLIARHRAAVGALWACRAAASSMIVPASFVTTSTAAAAEAAELPPELAAKTARVTVNGREIVVPEGVPILEAANRLGVHVPTLCAHPNLPSTPGTCRVCLVETGGGRLQPACATPVFDGMHVQTDTPRVKESVRGVLSLLKANHPADCMSCDVNGVCEFQDLINRYNVNGDAKDVLPLPKLRTFSHEWDDELHEDYQQYHDASGRAITLDLEKCLKCGRCVTACSDVQKLDVLGMALRSRGRHPSTAAASLDLSKCIECGQCSAVCPVGAIVERSEWRQVMELLDSKRKVMVCMTAPAVRVAIGEEVGLAPGTVTTGQMVAAQRALGFDYVFDVNFGADLTIMEEGSELLQRLSHALGGSSQPDTAGQQAENHAAPGPLPMFTSCCPAWVNLVEKSYPELIPNLSTCKSPQQMHGALIKRYVASKLGLAPEDVCLVSVMPCTAKKHEAERSELVRPGEGPDVDLVITTREFGHMLRDRKIPLASLPASTFDAPLGEGTGAGELFGATGGVMEAALRTAYELASGQPLPKLEIQEIRGLKGVKEASVTLPNSAPPPLAGQTVRVAVVSGIGNVRHLLQAMEAGQAGPYHFIEFMACPGGCIGGGGQPKTHDPLAVLKRMQGVYSIDERAVLRKSHENPAVQQVYKEYLGSPGSALAHELLHTHYTDRSHATQPPESHREAQQQHAAAEAHIIRLAGESSSGGTARPSVSCPMKKA